MITKNNKNMTIDLKEIIAKEYIESKKSNFRQILEIFIKIISFAGIMFYIMLSFGTWSGFISISKTNASELKQMSFRDNIRLERLKICDIAYQKYKKEKNIPFYVRNKLAVVSCAIRMHGVYVMESGAGKSKMCIERKSCLGIKTKVNGYYGHNGFSSYNEERKIFADKYFKYHFKKSPFTFIYGYKQKDGSYKWGWATGNRAKYVNLLNKVENDKNLISEYEYLYMTN